MPTDAVPNLVAITPEIRRAARARLEIARAAADEVGFLALASYQSPELVVDLKSDGSVVTEVDRGGEDLIRARIAGAFAGDAILGEEHGATAGRSQPASADPGAPSERWRWVIDPIDGTRSFTCGIPSFCTLIGIEHDGVPVAGLATFPALGEAVSAVRGEGAIWMTRSGDERPARATGVERADEASIELGAPGSFGRGNRRSAHPRFAAAVRRIRGWDDGLAFALVATGRVDGAVQGGLSRWDLSAFVPILLEAGAVADGWTAGDDPLEAPGNVIAGCPALVRSLQAVAAEAEDRA